MADLSSREATAIALRADEDQKLLPVVLHDDQPSTSAVTTASAAQGLMVDPRAVTRHHDPMDLVTLAQQVQQADMFVQATTSGKLKVIVEQIKFLQQQAKGILQSARKDAQLHHAACNFKKTPGHIYHLYEKQDRSAYFSMLSPQEWGSSCPHTFLGSYRLEYDQSWTPAEEVEERSRDMAPIHAAVLNAAPQFFSAPKLTLHNTHKSNDNQ